MEPNRVDGGLPLSGTGVVHGVVVKKHLRFVLQPPQEPGGRWVLVYVGEVLAEFDVCHASGAGTHQVSKHLTACQPNRWRMPVQLNTIFKRQWRQCSHECLRVLGVETQLCGVIHAHTCHVDVPMAGADQRPVCAFV